jgi:hypothetical protein
MDPARRERCYAFGLDRPLPQQYAEYIRHVLTAISARR